MNTLLNKIKHRQNKLIAKLFPNYSRKKRIAYLENNLDKLNIETIDVCNANCRFCAYTHKIRKNSLMKEELFKKIVDDYVEMGGEYFIDPNCWRCSA